MNGKEAAACIDLFQEQERKSVLQNFSISDALSLCALVVAFIALVLTLLQHRAIGLTDHVARVNGILREASSFRRLLTVALRKAEGPELRARLSRMDAKTLCSIESLKKIRKAPISTLGIRLSLMELEHDTGEIAREFAELMEDVGALSSQER